MQGAKSRAFQTLLTDNHYSLVAKALFFFSTRENWQQTVFIFSSKQPFVLRVYSSDSSTLWKKYDFSYKKKKKSFVLIQAHRHIWVSSAQILAEPRPHKAPPSPHYTTETLTWTGSSRPSKIEPQGQRGGNWASLCLGPLSPLPDPSCHSWRLLASVPCGAL